VEGQPEGGRFLAIRDANPNKPHRWLALPRFHGTNPQDLSEMTTKDREAYWTFAIRQATEVWGTQWALAVNNLERRTQCHMHIHIGRLSEGAEDDHFVTVKGAAEIPLPREGDGLWVHPAGSALHVHWGNDAPELLLEH
jgi:diadenosine tetraphosphate (Ap4A) HIT family hydrolase